ncbi:MAG: glycoside hydrolase family 31 protein [Staphylococcus sp.]|nr:glycoside hydrolase family 31 protein [Staphylococcus sp.]
MDKCKYILASLLAALTLAPAVADDVKIEFFTPDIVRVVKTPDGVADAAASLVVTAVPDRVKVKESKREGVTTYQSSSLKVTVDDRSGKVVFATADGSPLLSEGSYLFTPISEGIDKGAYKVKQGFTLDADEPIYGVGMMQNGKMSLRGEHRLMQQSNLEDFAHFFQSIKGYGIYWDNYSPTTLDDGGASLDLESQVGKSVDYYFLYGGDADGVIREMRHLTGKVPMLPLWTYGFHQSRERYKSSAELLDVVRRYRKAGIPFDGIIQDWQYWGSNYTWNAMEFINEDFSDAQRMIDEVHDNNAHISLSIWSSFGPQTKPYRELKEKGYLFSFETWPESGLASWPPRKDYPSGVRVYDCYSPEARDIYWNNLSRLHEMGIDAWWMDSTDPDHVNYKDSDLDEQCSAGSYRSVRNLFPFMAVGGVDSHQRAVDSLKRVFILTRSYFSGQQRYGANTWSGDVGSSWESLRNQVPICLNYTLTANPNVNTDIGGFFAGAYNRHYMDNSATRNPQYQELYVRWMQFGLFSPMMRSHGTDVYRELYYYGEPGEPVYDALLSAVKMRYNLLPYIYSTARQVSENDDSFMRALVMDFKDDRNVWDNGRQFMFGRNLLVCPVVDPLYTQEKVVKTDEQSGWNKSDDAAAPDEWPAVDWSETKKYSVYLPAGAGWYDYWTNEYIEGGRNVDADAQLARSPLYVRAGSILPIGADLQYTAEKPWDDMTLRIYPGEDATFTLYEDEGDNYNYLKGAYSEIPMTWNDRSRTLTIGSRSGKYPGMLHERKFTAVTPDGVKKEIKYTGRKVSVRF